MGNLAIRKLSFPASTKVELTPTSLNVLTELSAEELDDAWEFLGHADSGVMWWIGDLARYEEGKKNVSSEWYDEVEEKTGFKRQTIMNAVSVAKQLNSSVRTEELTFRHHEIIAGAFDTPSEQAKWLQKAVDNKWTTRQLRKQILATRFIDVPPLPIGTYNVIYIDPPWPISTSVWDKWEEPIDDKYPLMSIEDIQALPVAELSHDNTHLFLWTTLTFLPDAIKIIDGWSFQYHICLTWNKEHGFTLFGYYRNSELLLHSYKGKMPEEWGGEAFRTSFSEPATDHSRKPEIVYRFLEKWFLEPRLEMFARKRRPGWDVWGNEV